MRFFFVVVFYVADAVFVVAGFTGIAWFMEKVLAFWSKRLIFVVDEDELRKVLYGLLATVWLSIVAFKFVVLQSVHGENRVHSILSGTGSGQFSYPVYLAVCFVFVPIGCYRLCRRVLGLLRPRVWDAKVSELV